MFRIILNENKHLSTIRLSVFLSISRYFISNNMERYQIEIFRTWQNIIMNSSDACLNVCKSLWKNNLVPWSFDSQYQKVRGRKNWIFQLLFETILSLDTSQLMKWRPSVVNTSCNRTLIVQYQHSESKYSIRVMGA